MFGWRKSRIWGERELARGRWARLVWLGTGLAAAGCAQRAQDAAAPVYSLQPGMAGLYVLNASQETVFPSQKTISDGGTEIARLGYGRYVFVPIAPGRHNLRCDDLPLTNDVTIEAAAGRLYYLRIEMGATAQVQKCELLTQATGNASLRLMKPEGQD
jgi:hypothetical protein